MTTPATPVLDQINIIVSDMGAAVDFYQRLGVMFEAAPPPWDCHHRSAKPDAGVDLDLDSVEFAAMWNRGTTPGRGGAVIGFRLSDRGAVDQLFADITDAGHPGRQEPYDAFWGARYAVVEDPDGNPVGLMSPIDPARRTATPTPPA